MTNTRIAKTTNILLQSQVTDFFRKSEGRWSSQRRYYSLRQDVEPQEVESILDINFLEQGSPELVKLAIAHQLDNITSIACGTKVTWKSNYTNQNRKAVEGSTVFGIQGNVLYRDRGFATPKPVIAVCAFPNPDTMNLCTEYKANSFEEEIKLIGAQYRTRQTIISRAGQEITIGQYLEKRIA